jgi:hypothetical protein
MADVDFSLNFVCPTCKARPQEECTQKSGAPLFTSHGERWDIADDYERSAAFREDSPLSVWMKPGLFTSQG